MTGSAPSSKKFGGLLTRKMRWGLSWRGWLILILAGASTVIFLLLNIQPFLARTQRVNTKVLVVEGWIDEYAIHAAVVEFKNGSYQKIFTTGGPIIGFDGSTNDFDTTASVGAQLLEEYGIATNLVQMVPSHIGARDRTYNSALALRNWFHQHNVDVHSINVLTQDVHARRTQLLFQEAFGRDVTVGIISAPDPDYDPKHWWRYSEGVRQVLAESIAYFYARVLFHPPENSAEK